MSSTMRSIGKHANALSRGVNSSTTIRSFHSPFTVLGNSPVTSPPPTSKVPPIDDQNWDPSFSSNHVLRTYVVSHDPSHTFYSVPSGAYPTSAPYVHFNATEPANVHGAQASSITTTLAHTKTTRHGAAAPHEGGFGGVRL